MRDPEALIEFARRAWDPGEAGGGGTAAARIRIADELRRQVRRMRADWPSERDRREDFAFHLVVVDALRRVPPRGR